MTTHDRPFSRHLEQITPGDIYKHWPGKTITEYDDHLFCMIYMSPGRVPVAEAGTVLSMISPADQLAATDATIEAAMQAQ